MVDTQSLGMPAVSPESRPGPFALANAHQAALILTAVLAGAVMATWLVELSLGGSTAPWIEYHQATTAAYTLVLPPIAALALVAAVAALAASWQATHRRRLILGALVCLLMGLTVTAVVHVPLDNEIALWQPTAPPADWQQLRDRWLVAHAVRAALVLAALALLTIAGHDGRRTAHRTDV